MAVGLPLKTTYANGDVYSASDVNDTNGTINANATPYAAGKNKIINGAMTISQRGTSFTPTTNLTYTLDRWVAQLTAASKFSVAQSTTNAPNTNGYSMLVTSLSAYSVAAGDTFAISQRVEGFNWRQFAFGTADAKTITLSFLVRSSLTGTFSGSLTNSAEDRSYPFTYTISAANTWEQKSVTIAGDTSGSWLYDNQIGAKLFFNLGAGATYSGTAGAWTGSGKYAATGSVSLLGTNAATLQITNVQIEQGSTATPFQTATGTIQGELAACQRYYWRVTAMEAYSVFNDGYGASSTECYGTVQFPVVMRTSPTAIEYSTIGITDMVTTVAATSVVYALVTNATARIGALRSSGGLTAGKPYTILANNSTSAYIGWSAEL
jgi:hypothetical protein